MAEQDPGVIVYVWLPPHATDTLPGEIVPPAAADAVIEYGPVLTTTFVVVEPPEAQPFTMQV
jgi:hypothetical protein